MNADALAMLRRRIKNMRKSEMRDAVIEATLVSDGWDRGAVERAMKELAR